MNSKKIVFDTGPIITLATNNLLWVLEQLKAHFGGEFYITKKVKEELVDKPLQTKKFRFEAIQILPLITSGILKIYESSGLDDISNKILDLSNSSYSAKNNNMKILHPAETEVVAAAIELGADAIVIDETTTRYLIESPQRIITRLNRKLHTGVKINKENLSELKNMFGKINVIRSFELGIIAYELGLFDKFMDEKSKKLIPNLKKEILVGILWAFKLNGCSVKNEDIDDVISLEFDE